MFKELYHTICGKDGRLSIRRVLAVWFSGVLTKYVLASDNPADAVVYGLILLISGLLYLNLHQHIAEIKNPPFNPESETGNAERHV